ncbi:putative gluconokinase [Neosynchiropus ocellatus]
MIYVIMGVSGCGKSALGAYLSEKLGWRLYEGDDFHPQENIDKMTRGVQLTDEDRLPWLLKLHEVIDRERRRGSDALVTCSALKRLYRNILTSGSTAVTSSCPSEPSPLDVFFLFLQGDYQLIHQRISARTGHYMRADLLSSQFEVLEPPLEEEENVMRLDIRKSLSDMGMEVESHLRSVRDQERL